MSKIGIIVDSACDIEKETRDELDIDIIPLWVHFKNESLRDEIDIDKDSFCKKLEEELPKTSVPSPEEMMSVMDSMFAKGYDELIIITVSTGLSGVYNSLVSIVKDEKKYSGKVHVFDSLNIGIGSGFYGVYAKQLVKKGCNSEEIMKELTAVRDEDRCKVFYTLPSLYNLMKGGRIGLVKGLVGSVLNIKPVITVNKDGIYTPVFKARGFKKAKEKIVSHVLEQLKDAQEFYISLCYGGDKTAIESMKEPVKNLFKKAAYSTVQNIAPTLQVHTGKGLVGLGYLKIR